jgi:hypothetical protein
MHKPSFTVKVDHDLGRPEVQPGRTGPVANEDRERLTRSMRMSPSPATDRDLAKWARIPLAAARQALCDCPAPTPTRSRPANARFEGVQVRAGTGPSDRGDPRYIAGLPVLLDLDLVASAALTGRTASAQTPFPVAVVLPLDMEMPVIPRPSDGSREGSSAQSSEHVAIVGEGLELQRIARRVREEHRPLLSRLSGETQIGFDEELGASGCSDSP